MEELKKNFRPEFLNRIDEIDRLPSLDEEHIAQIVSLMAEDLRKRLKEQDIDFVLTEEAKKYLAKEGLIRHTALVRCAERFRNTSKTVCRKSC